MPDRVCTRGHTHMQTRVCVRACVRVRQACRWEESRAGPSVMAGWRWAGWEGGPERPQNRRKELGGMEAVAPSRAIHGEAARREFAKETDCSVAGEVDPAGPAPRLLQGVPTGLSE